MSSMLFLTTPSLTSVPLARPAVVAGFLVAEAEEAKAIDLVFFTGVDTSFYYYYYF